MGCVEKQQHEKGVSPKGTSGPMMMMVMMVLTMMMITTAISNSRHIIWLIYVTIIYAKRLPVSEKADFTRHGTC